MQNFNKVRAFFGSFHESLTTLLSVQRLFGYSAVGVMSLVLSACGGGGDAHPSPTPIPITLSPANGTYTAYATNGERFTLTVDIEKSQYSWKGLTVSTYASGGSLAASTPSDVFTFGANGGAGKTSRFRYVDGFIVGNFDFGTGVVPFVASKQFALTFAEIVGTYNVIGVSRTTAGVNDSAIYSSRISADAKLNLCNDSTVFSIDKCPFGSIKSYALTVDSSGTFLATPPLPATDFFSFKVAKTGSGFTYLMASVNQTTGTRFFRIGVPESSTFPAGTSYGGSNSGEWGVANFTSTTYSSTGVAADGRAIALNGSINGLGVDGPTGMKIAQFPNGASFVLQNAQLAAFVGARNGPAVGYIQIGSK